jgi:hypothetical protein
MPKMTATDPPRKMPWLCRIGLHSSTYSNTVGEKEYDGLWVLKTTPCCNRCHHPVGEATLSVVDPNGDDWE